MVSGGSTMTQGELLYLVMTVSAFGIFMATLALVDHQNRRTRRPARQAAPHRMDTVADQAHAR
jgi:hypothetical protein